MKVEVNVTLTIDEANVLRQFLVNRLDELENKYSQQQLDRSYPYDVILRLRNKLTIM